MYSIGNIRKIRILSIVLLVLPISIIASDEPVATGNGAIFFHPDGTSASHWDAARLLHYGPDGLLNWDRLPEMAQYRGHLSDQLVATSNAGAVIHATGTRVYSESFGLDAAGNPYPSANGSELTIMQQAVQSGIGSALVQTGSLIEPGTAAFVARAPQRRDYEQIALQVVNSGVQVMLGAGEEWLLPEGVQGRFGEGSRTDGLNLIDRLEERGYAIVYTRDELINLPDDAEYVFGVFALENTFNDQSEEQLIAQGLDNFLASAPTVAEMTDFALSRMQRHDDGFLLVIEEEGTDNMCNRQNASGCLEAMKRADDAIGVIQNFIDRNPDTFMVLASDSNANGPQVLTAPKGVQTLPSNDPITGSAIDGVAGTGSAPFMAKPDNNGNVYPFAIGWASGFDVGSGVIARASGLHADRLVPVTGVDNTDIYRMLYYVLFGEQID